MITTDYSEAFRGGVLAAVMTAVVAAVEAAVVAAVVAVNECVIFFRAAAMAAMACAAVSTGTWIRFEPLELKMHSAGESMRSA